MSIVSRTLDKARSEGWEAVLRRGGELALERGYGAFGVRQVTLHLTRREVEDVVGGAESVMETIEALQDVDGYGVYEKWGPGQIPAELREFVEYLNRVEPERFVEVGLGNCGTMYTILKHVPSIETYIGVDLPRARHRERGVILEDVAESASVHFVTGDSQSEQTVTTVSELLGGEADFVFIDADHTYEGVSGDFETYRDLVVDGGAVGLHDIRAREDSVIEVDKFWSEVKSDFPTESIVATYDLSDPITVNGHAMVGHGIGIVQL